MIDPGRQILEPTERETHVHAATTPDLRTRPTQRDTRGDTIVNTYMYIWTHTHIKDLGPCYRS